MENYTISKESVLALAATSQTARLILTENFPDAFKKELEVGKWYKRPHNSALFYVTEILNIDSNYCKVFGFDNLGHWMAENAKTFPDNDFEATPKQVETALINQAKKKGFIKGVEHYITNGSANLIARGSRFYFDKYRNKLLFNNWSIFENGKWAEIIPEETKVISVEKAEKILSEKYGQKVEIK